MAVDRPLPLRISVVAAVVPPRQPLATRFPIGRVVLR
jgi:hypothetical protein